MNSKAELILCVLQKIPSSLSLIGSSCIVSSVFRSKENRKNIQQRLVGGMSIVDILAAFTWLTTNLWMPKSYERYPATHGNDISCNIHGFMTQMFNLASVLYSLLLSIYYLLVIKYRWPDRKFRLLEKIFHIIPWSFGFISALVPAILGLYNPAIWNCWIATDYKEASPDDTTRALVYSFQVAFFYGPLVASISLCSISMSMIYLYVRKTELRTAGAQVAAARLVRTKQVAWQGAFFVTAMIVTWFFAGAIRIAQRFDAIIPPGLNVLAGTLAPSQGFFNSLAYFRIRYARQRRGNPDIPRWIIAAGIVRAQLIPCWKLRTSLQDDGNDCENKLNDDNSNSVLPQRPKRYRKKPTEPTEVSEGDDWKALRAKGVKSIKKKSASKISSLRTKISSLRSKDVKIIESNAGGEMNPVSVGPSTKVEVEEGIHDEE